MRLFKGKITYNQHVSVSEIDKNSVIITAHECNDHGDKQINANSNVTNNCNTSETVTETNRCKEKITKNGQHSKEKKEIIDGVQQVDKNGELYVLC